MERPARAITFSIVGDRPLAVFSLSRYFLGMNRLMFMLIFAAGLAGLIVAADEIIRQDRVQQRFIEVSAHIDSFSFSPWGKASSHHFIPIVRYHFDLAGRHYVGTNFSVKSVVLNEEKARALEKEYSSDSRIAALVDPTQPQNAVLILDYPLAYYWLLAGSVFATVIGAGGLTGMIRMARRTMKVIPKVTADGFREVLSGKPIAERRTANLLLLTTGVVLDIALPINWLTAHGPVSGDGIAFILCLSTLVVILVVAQWRIWQLSSTLAQPRVFIQPFPISRGTPVQIRLAVEAKQPLKHLHVRAWLLCIETSLHHLGRRAHMMRENVVEYIAAEQEKSDLTAGSVLDASRRLTISSGTPATGKADVLSYPSFRWTLRLEFSGSRNYIADFPLEIC